jgi:hypothetical protein
MREKQGKWVFSQLQFQVSDYVVHMGTGPDFTGYPTNRALGLFLRGTSPGIGSKLLFSLPGI